MFSIICVFTRDKIIYWIDGAIINDDIASPLRGQPLQLDDLCALFYVQVVVIMMCELTTRSLIGSAVDITLLPLQGWM